MVANYSFKFTETAEEDLNYILKYISNDLSNTTAANILTQRIFECIDNVRVFPELGLVVENEYLTDRTLRRVLVDNYSVYYKTDDNNKIIYIVRLIYSRRDVNEILRNL